MYARYECDFRGKKRVLDHMKLGLFTTDSDVQIKSGKQSLGLQQPDLDVRQKSGKHSATESFTQPQELPFSNTIV